ncbi:MAG: Na+:solute symporter [Fidelibacterota bacterium]|nr:MAG: Na+:solute symporter [Candidatus Neomarinimicrobiota bacterium]
MNLAFVDWVIIGVYLVFSMGIAVYYSRRAGKSTSEFFLTGRNLPWYIAGTAMVATTFAADTPLAVTELVAKNGIAGNWLWWNMLFGGMLTTFFFARLWRRAGILTDVEFTELRYSGKPAAFLRGFRALYLGLLMNLVIMGWVNLAMVKILSVMFPGLTFFGIKAISLLGFEFPAALLWVGMIMLVVAIYSSMAGLWGVAITDTFQFIVAMGGTIALAVIVVNVPEIGGVAGLKEKLPEWVFQFTPSLGEQGSTVGGVLTTTVAAFIAYIGVQWWASWYPGADPGGGGYVAQRMMSAKDEKHSLFATLWFMIAHYAVRPWPWIIVALVSLVLYPELDWAHKGDGFVMVMRDYLPAGLLGVLMAAFLAAYMSTIATQLNWGASYIVNDFYRRFIRAEGEEKYYVRVSRITTVATMLISLLITSQLNRISGAWEFIIGLSGGIGLVLILRWWWWRINAWSEIAAMVAPLIIYPLIHFYPEEISRVFPFLESLLEFPNSLFIIVPWTTAAWLIATYLTKPTNKKTLHTFYRRIHPGGVLWKAVAVQLPEVESDSGYRQLFIDWIAGCFLVFFALFGFGKIILGEHLQGLLFLMIAAAAASVIYWHLSRVGWEKVGD